MKNAPLLMALTVIWPLKVPMVRVATRPVFDGTSRFFSQFVPCPIGLANRMANVPFSDLMVRLTMRSKNGTFAEVRSRYR